MIDLPHPLTPVDCELRDFKFMPLDVVRLRDSDLAALTSGDEFRCAVLLWCASWHQIPAASLPDDDLLLAQYAGFGRVVKEWQKVRSGALRGWIKCADDRLYHPVVAEKANESWIAKLKQRLKTECARIKKHNERHGTRLPFPDFDAWLVAGCPVGQPLFVPSDNRPVSPGQDGAVTGETASKGQGEGQGQGQGQGQLTTKPEDRHHHAGSIAEPVVGDPSDFDPPLYGAPLPPREDLPPPAGENQPAIELTVDLRKWGVNATFTNPHVQDWAKNPKVTRDILAAAVAEAREFKGTERLSPGYLVPIVNRLLNPPPMVDGKPQQQREDNSWAASDSGITAKARELGIKVLPIHSYADVKRMCFDEIRKRKGGKP